VKSQNEEKKDEKRFGNALELTVDGTVFPEAAPCSAYTKFPLTVECLVKLGAGSNAKLILSSETKNSSTHWELHSYEINGYLGAYLPGFMPSVISSEESINDDKWHILALVVDENSAKLFVDSEKVADVGIEKRKNMDSLPAPLTVGALYYAPDNYGAGCDGEIAELRISNTAREIIAASDEPFKAENDTVGLWNFTTNPDDGVYRDYSTTDNPMITKRLPRISLDEMDMASYNPCPSPMDSEAVNVELKKEAIDHLSGISDYILDGEWEMVEGGDQEIRLNEGWTDVTKAIIPGSVHTALEEADVIPDPKFGLNDKVAREKSMKTWWFRKNFQRPRGMTGEKLVFGGVAVKTDVWLNGNFLGSHEGMFGGPEFDISQQLEDENVLIVKIYSAPYEIGEGFPNEFFLGMNIGWMRTVVFNNVYGWHYSDIPSLGIWRSVRIIGTPSVDMKHPFIATRDVDTGTIDLSIDLYSLESNCAGILNGTIEPENFNGNLSSFSYKIVSKAREGKVHLSFSISDPKLWWPNGMGEQNLYRMKLSFNPDHGNIPDYKELVFGIRTVDMAPLSGGPYHNKFNWTYVINKKPMFVKGTGWCTMDSSMDFSYERYKRLISLAHEQHVQMLRAWGSGMPETDEFYDLCNRYGIMVMQEWPTAWDTHKWQPYEMLEETVRLNTIRLRNNPSLVMWGGGNESGDPYGEAIDMMGRYSVELDGTRPFHRGEPFGGSVHNYGCWWQREHLDYNLQITADFFGEFGLASLPVYESVQRYLPDEEKNVWPPENDSAFAHHTPVFNMKEDMERLMQYAEYFVSNKNMKECVVGSQLAQAVGVRHTLELARTRWPNCTGALYYKMNDNYPAVSWACVDWYGAPKIGHYIFQDSFAPIHACVIFNELNSQGKKLSLPVYLLDDADELGDSAWQVIVRAYGPNLKEIKRTEFKGNNSIDNVKKLGEFSLDNEQTKSTPLFTVAEVIKENKLVDRTFYWTNYEAIRGCLFSLPTTRLEMKIKSDNVVITNIGDLPAVAVNINRPGHADKFSAEDNYFWLDPGESRSIKVSDTDGLKLSAWNFGNNL